MGEDVDVGRLNVGRAARQGSGPGGRSTRHPIGGTGLIWQFCRFTLCGLALGESRVAILNSER